MTPKTGGLCDRTLTDLFTDDVFVDFFNTFLNLPVFGQTPLYILKENHWYLCPEIPHCKDVRRGSFFEWIQAHRFVYFRQSELCHYYCLCKEFLWFSSCQAQDVLKWTSADQWLLKRCLGSVRGVRRFCCFVKGTRGEELMSFCVRVERLLQIDWRDGTQRSRYEALLTVIKAVHLTEGSNTMATCRITMDGLLEIFSGCHPGEMKEQILAEMRSKAVYRLQTYWLPQYLSACKAAITRLKECESIAREYEDVASRPTLMDNPVPPGPSSWSLSLEPPVGPTVTRTYCSKVGKRVLWRSQQKPGTPDGPDLWQWFPMAGEGDQGECNNIVHLMIKQGEVIMVEGDNKREASGRREVLSRWSGRGKRSAPLRKVISASQLPSTGPPSTCLPILPSVSLPSLGKGIDIIPPHACMETPICQLPSIISTTPLPPTSPPPPTPVSGLACDEHLYLALSADALAGGPYEVFLRIRGQAAMLHHLGLWQELDSFLNLLLKMEDGPSKALRKVVAKKIVAVYLRGALGHEGKMCNTWLSDSTTMQLINLLPSGNVMSWVYTAKQELCKILAPSYNAFLDNEDKHLLSYLFGQTELKGKISRGSVAPPGGPGAPEQQVKRMREALALCQACCCGHGDTETLSEETWALLPLEDLSRGGSIHLHYRKTDLYDLPFETLVQRYPKVAVEEISKTHRLYCDWQPIQDDKLVVSTKATAKKVPFTVMKRDYSFVRRPSRRPRSLNEVMKNSTNLEFFKHYLRSHEAHGAILFYQEVEKLRTVTRVRSRKTKINSIVARFLRRADAEEYLQCSANLIAQIRKMKYVSPDVLFAAQDVVLKSVEAKWFRKYQDTFPPCVDVEPDPLARSVILTDKLKYVWRVFFRFIKSICKFRNAMKDLSVRSSFEAFLRNNWQDFSCKYISAMGKVESVGLCAEDGDSTYLKRRVLNNKMLTVDFLVNDLSFYLEMESYRKMADSGTVMASAGMYGESDHALLHHKADMIMKLFIKSEIAPRLRINITESTKESIQQAFAMGKVNRELFHKATMAIFPNLIFCWRKFCSQTVKRGFAGDNEGKKEVVLLPDYLHPFNSGSNWYHKVQTSVSVTDDCTTLRFTVYCGLNLILPQTTRTDLKVCGSILGPAKTKPTPGSTSVSPDFPSLNAPNQRKKSCSPIVCSPQAPAPRLDATQSSSGSSLPKITEETD